MNGGGECRVEVETLVDFATFDPKRQVRPDRLVSLRCLEHSMGTSVRVGHRWFRDLNVDKIAVDYARRKLRNACEHRHEVK